MRYIFQTNQCNSDIQAKIASSGITIKTNLYKRDNGGEMWSIYDDKTNSISFYNNISKERTTPHRVIKFPKGGIIVSTFISILSHLRGFISIKTKNDGKESVIVGYGKKLKDDKKFEDLFVENSFDQPLTLKIASNYVNEDYSFLITKELSKEYNLGIISIYPREIDEDYDEDEDSESREHEGSSSLINGIDRVTTIFYKIVEDETLYGCKSDQFINGLKNLCIKDKVSEWLKNGKFNAGIVPSDKIVEERILMEDPEKLGIGLHYVIVRDGKNTITISLRDFLASTDIPITIMWNMLDNMNHCPEYRVQSAIVLSQNNEDEESCGVTRSEDYNSLLYLPNLLEFKNYKFNLTNGECS